MLITCRGPKILEIGGIVKELQGIKICPNSGSQYLICTLYASAYGLFTLTKSLLTKSLGVLVHFVPKA